MMYEQTFKFIPVCLASLHVQVTNGSHVTLACFRACGLWMAF